MRILNLTVFLWIFMFLFLFFEAAFGKKVEHSRCDYCYRIVNNSYRLCFYGAAYYYEVSPEILMSIAWVESKMNPRALNRNKNRTYDIGIMQINSSWIPYLARYGIRPGYLWDPCYNIYVGAMVLKYCMNNYGNTWKAIDCYNKGIKGARKSSRYIWKVYSVLKSALTEKANTPEVISEGDGCRIDS